MSVTSGFSHRAVSLCSLVVDTRGSRHRLPGRSGHVRSRPQRNRRVRGGIYAPGALPGPGNRRTWEAMDRGDRVLYVYDNTYRYAARVLAK
jgi:hypothetical protein